MEIIKKTLDKTLPKCYNKDTKKDTTKEIKIMKYYEIKHIPTNTAFTATAKNTKEACAMNGYKARECKVIYSAKSAE